MCLIIWQAYHSSEIKPQRLVYIPLEQKWKSQKEVLYQKGIKKEVLYYLLQPVCVCFFGCCQLVLFFKCSTCFSLFQVFQSRGWSAKSPRLLQQPLQLILETPSPTLPHCGCLKLLILPMRRVLPVSHFLRSKHYTIMLFDGSCGFFTSAVSLPSTDLVARADNGQLCHSVFSFSFFWNLHVLFCLMVFAVLHQCSVSPLHCRSCWLCRQQLAMLLSFFSFYLSLSWNLENNVCYVYFSLLCSGLILSLPVLLSVLFLLCMFSFLFCLFFYLFVLFCSLICSPFYSLIFGSSCGFSLVSLEADSPQHKPRVCSFFLL